MKEVPLTLKIHERYPWMMHKMWIWVVCYFFSNMQVVLYMFLKDILK